MYNIHGKNDQKDDLLKKHAPLVKKLAYRLKARLPPSVEVDDLIQAGMMGLLSAVNNYEDTHGAQFETYASQRIHGAMLDELRSADWLPRGLRKKMRQVEDAINALQQQYGRPPSETEVARHLKCTLDEYYEMLGDCSGHQLVYYEDFHDSDGGDHFLDRHLSDAGGDPLQALMSEGFKEALVEVIDSLPERERILMGLYYGEELNLKEIGAVLNVSESRVCQMHSQAIARLRARLKEQAWTGVA
ncbi:MAG: RNA polymerase sigma factor FliA [Betaproteobacteria bacterium HGW-Betaproteobacteria-1]|jgi:RNA polymerase sigma factor for flagellar operon FliA|nr:MAG: RNA polymerase sigma factor FliA [Betaproteobacteria bacterium HGW-Betaproteobacteria-1]